MTKHCNPVLILSSLSITGERGPVYTRAWQTEDGSCICAHCAHKLPFYQGNDNRFCLNCGRLMMDIEESDEDIREAAMFKPECTVASAEQAFREATRTNSW